MFVSLKESQAHSISDSKQNPLCTKKMHRNFSTRDCESGKLQHKDLLLATAA